MDKLQISKQTNTVISQRLEYTPPQIECINTNIYLMALLK